ncbi:tryptophan 2,3-dioxygenase [Sciscionella sediminilitoris]|uniref:tryptophan 2,3-dioxygenase n=1 Tax=Sciscionella sediminilitoris TaxID=1445613 RepID=UPI00068EA87F|nr:tryptophan 2,3-dioxygenase family protein [Sciscionella sp. SE31]
MRTENEELTYAQYLRLDLLLSAQRPRTDPELHDELLFIVQHHTSELWFKLIIHELRWACARLRGDDLRAALKAIARVKHVQHQLFEQWAVLETLTPDEFIAFRHVLKQSSGFQSAQYRVVEFMLGNKNAELLPVFDEDPEGQALLRTALEEPSLYDEFLRYLARAGHPVPAEVLDRDVRAPHTEHAGITALFAGIYRGPHEHWQLWETCEELVDLEESFQLWRFRHMKAVERIIGSNRGTGGSSGVEFLRAALDSRFFPEILAVRTELAHS